MRRCDRKSCASYFFYFMYYVRSASLPSCGGDLRTRDRDFRELVALRWPAGKNTRKQWSRECERERARSPRRRKRERRRFVAGVHWRLPGTDLLCFSLQKKEISKQCRRWRSAYLIWYRTRARKWRNIWGRLLMSGSTELKYLRWAMLILSVFVFVLTNWYSPFCHDVSIRSQQNYTPLHAALREGHLDIMSFLISQGADIEATAEVSIVDHSLLCLLA